MLIRMYVSMTIGEKMLDTYVLRTRRMAVGGWQWRHRGRLENDKLVMLQCAVCMRSRLIVTSDWTRA